MSNRPTNSASNTAILMLKIAITLTGTLGTMFLLTRLEGRLPHGEALLVATALLGGAVLLHSLRHLFRELAAPPTPRKPQRQPIGR